MNRGLNTGMALLIAAATLIACSGQTPDQVSATVPLWDARDYHLIRALGAFGGFDYSDIAFSPDGELIVADTANGLFLWKSADGLQLLGGNPGLNSMAGTFSPTPTSTRLC